MKKALTEQDILELLNNLGYDNMSKTRVNYGYANKNFEWKMFVERYARTHPDVEEFKDPAKLKELAARTSKNIEENKIFAKFFSRPETPIYWFDDSYWTLFSMRTMSESKTQWDTPQSSNYYSYYDSQYDSKRIEILKDAPKEGLFEALTEFLSKSNKILEGYIVIWIELAKKKSNQATLENQALPKFLKKYILERPYKYIEPTAIRKIAALSYFKTEEAIQHIETLREEFVANAKILDFANKILKDLGRDAKEIDMSFNEEYVEHIKYIHKQALNPQALIQKKNIKANHVDEFIQLMTMFLDRKLHEKGIKVTECWENKWDEKIGKEKKVYVLTFEMDYQYQCSDTKDYVKKVFDVGVKYLLEDVNRAKMKAYLQDYNGRSDFMNFFSNYVEKASLKDKIESDLTKETDKKSSRLKI